MKIEYYARIYSKNNAGTFNLSAQRESDNAQVDVTSGLGYAPVTKTVYSHIILPNPITNMVTCCMFLFRDGSGTPSRGGWEIAFDIVHFVGANSPVSVTPKYEIRAKDYYDGCGLQMELSPFCTPQDLKQLLIRNAQLYKDYLNTKDKIFKYPYKSSKSKPEQK